MATLSITGVVREILSANLDLPADEVIKKAKARGLTASESNIRYTVHNVRSDLKKAARAMPAPPVAQSQAQPVASNDLATILANVALVNRIVGLCGGVDNARQVAEAVRACGGTEPFLQHLDLVAGIRGGEPAA